MSMNYKSDFYKQYLCTTILEGDDFMNQTAVDNLEKSCKLISEARNNLRSASYKVQGNNTTMRIDGQIAKIENCLNDCKTISSQIGIRINES